MFVYSVILLPVYCYMLWEDGVLGNMSLRNTLLALTIRADSTLVLPIWDMGVMCYFNSWI